MTRQFRFIVTAAFLFLASTSLALGASLTIDSSNSGNGIFTVQGNNMDEVAAMDLILSYDTPALASPTVNQDSLISGALMAANTNNPGSIRIAIAKPSSFSGSGPVITITFATHTGGSVKIVSSNLIDVSGNTVPSEGSTSTASGFNSAPGISFTPTPSTTPATTSTTTPPTNPTTTPSPGNSPGATGSSGPTYLGTVTMPSDNQPQIEVKTAPAPTPEAAAKPVEATASAETPVPAQPPTPDKPAATPKKSKTIRTTVNTAVLERFRAYQGAKTPAIMIGLFKKPISPYFHQEPIVALSDGTTTVTIVADLSAVAGASPNFALHNAKLVSLKKDKASSRWIIEALPAKNALKASLMVLSGDQVAEYPLTIAPAIPNAAATEAEFAAFFKDAAKSPARHDINGDGKYDGVDDYIYTANYLVRRQKAKPAAK